MKLKPVIASYSGESFFKINQYLNENVLGLIASIAESPKLCEEIAPEVLAELVEMHVLDKQNGLVKLNTAVFVKNDIENILSAVTPLAKELGQRVFECGLAFKNAPAAVTIFLAGIIGLVQGMGRELSQKRIGSAEWKTYSGKYARSKVDFDELCDLDTAIGPDCLNKSVLQGERFTAVFIGPGGSNFQSLNAGTHSYDQSKSYTGHLNRFLVDEYAMLVSGSLQSEPLLASAEAAGMYQQGRLKSAVITNATMQHYTGAVQAIIETTSSYYAGKLDMLDELLRSTTSGQQGVPPAAMMMHLWRYIRRVTGKELYANGFFTDSIFVDGCLTVFYENNVELIRKLLY